MPQVPATFELDENGEASAVHVYCSDSCRSSAPIEGLDNPTDGESDYCDGNVCEQCGKPL